MTRFLKHLAEDLLASWASLGQPLKHTQTDTPPLAIAGAGAGSLSRHSKSAAFFEADSKSAFLEKIEEGEEGDESSWDKRTGFHRSNAKDGNELLPGLFDEALKAKGGVARRDGLVAIGEESDVKGRHVKILAATKLLHSAADKSREVAGLFKDAATAVPWASGFSCAGAILNTASAVKDTMDYRKALKVIREQADVEGPLKDYNLCMVKAKRANAYLAFMNAGVDAAGCIADLATSGASIAVTGPIGAAKGALVLSVKMSTNNMCNPLKKLMESQGNEDEVVDSFLKRAMQLGTADTVDDATGAIKDGKGLFDGAEGGVSFAKGVAEGAAAQRTIKQALSAYSDIKDSVSDGIANMNTDGLADAIHDALTAAGA